MSSVGHKRFTRALTQSSHCWSNTRSWNHVLGPDSHNGTSSAWACQSKPTAALAQPRGGPRGRRRALAPPCAALTGRPPAASAPSSAPRTAPGAALSPPSRWCYHPTASFRCPGHPDRRERLGQQMLPGKRLDIRLRPSPPRCGMRGYNHRRDLSETSSPGPIQVPLPARSGEARLT